jgi:hypothetical protein
MNLAEQVLQLKTDIDDVYKAGKKASGGVVECDVDHAALRQEGYDEGFDAGYAEGVVDSPNPLEYCQTAGSLFTDIIFPTGYELILNIPVVKNLDRCFYKTSGMKKVTVKGNNIENVINFTFAFRLSSDLETIDLEKYKVKISNANYMFAQSKKLKEILGVLDFSECTNVGYAFYDCLELVTVTPKENSITLSISFSNSSKLSVTSVQSIIDGLATVATKQTLTLHSSVSSTLTSDQMAQILSKNWEIV